MVGLVHAEEGGDAVSPTLRRLHLMHRDVRLRESRRLAPIPRPNIAGMDIPDASAYLRNSVPTLRGFRQFVGNSSVSACVGLRLSRIVHEKGQCDLPKSHCPFFMETIYLLIFLFRL